jgi:hypothetical protein
VSPSERRRLWLAFLWTREEFPLAFVSVNEGVEMDDSISKLNEALAAAACNAAQALLEADGRGVVFEILLS